MKCIWKFLSKISQEPLHLEFEIWYNLGVMLLYCVRENQHLILPSFFSFFHFSISHSNVMYREICVKDFSRTTAPRILKYGTTIGYDLLYCARENQHP